MMNFLKRNSLLVLYMIVLVFLLIGLYKHSGFTYFDETLIYMITFAVFYLGLKSKILRDKVARFFSYFTRFFDRFTLEQLDRIALLMIVVNLVFIAGHIFYIHTIPFYHAMKSFNYSEIVWIRRNITLGRPGFWNYGMSFILKAVFPVLLLFFYTRKKWSFFGLLVAVGAFYCLFTMQKSYFLTVFLPVIIFSFFRKKFLSSLGLLLIPVLSIAFLVIITNPTMKFPFLSKEMVEVAKKEIAESSPGIVIEEPEAETNFGDNPFVRLANKSVHIISRRLMIVPGEMLSIWYQTIPDSLPYLNGAGYRLGAKFLGEEYHDYSMELYPIARPKNVAKGFIGSLNVASFMYDYANFGRWGLFFSAIVLAMIFVTVEVVFNNNLLKLSLNAFYVLMLSSSALSILLLSGGWMLVVFLYLMFRNAFEYSLKAQNSDA